MLQSPSRWHNVRGLYQGILQNNGFEDPVIGTSTVCPLERREPFLMTSCGLSLLKGNKLSPLLSGLLQVTFLIILMHATPFTLTFICLFSTCTDSKAKRINVHATLRAHPLHEAMTCKAKAGCPTPAFCLTIFLLRSKVTTLATCSLP